jgi:hypothetical protein
VVFVRRRESVGVAEGIQRELTGDRKTKCVAVELVDDFDADSVGVGIPEEGHFEAVLVAIRD